MRTGIDIQGANAEYVEGSTVIHFLATGFGTNCGGDWSFLDEHDGKSSAGAMSVVVGGGAPPQLSFLLLANSTRQTTGLVHDVYVLDCVTRTEVGEWNYEGCVYGRGLQ